MVSILAIPEQKSSNTVTVELKPAHTREWLARLPLLHEEDCLRQIFQALHEFNRVSVKPGARLRLLELYRTPLKFLGENIEKMLWDKYSPLSDRHGVLAELCRRVTIEMAYGYKSVVLDSATTLRSSRSNRDLSTAIHRSIRYLTHTLFNSAMCYNSYPAGTWMEIHSLFEYARKLRIQSNQVKDALNRARPKNDISHVYQQAILFGICDSYKQPVTITAKLHCYLDRWASSVEISRFRSVPTTRCQFVIDPAQDRPAQPYTEGLAAKRSKQLLLLDARVITRSAHDQWHRLRAGTSPSSSGLGDGFFDKCGIDMLERVVQAWGLAPRRKYPRNAISGPYQLALGINACNFYLNGARTFMGVADDSEHRIQLATSGTFGLQQVKKREEDHVKQHWQGANESKHGICIYVDLSRPAAILVRVGEVVAFRTNRGEARWSAGLVRWIRITDTELRAGVQKLGAGARAVATRFIENSGLPAGMYKNSVSVPKHEELEQAQSLLTPPGMYQKNRTMLIDDGAIIKKLHAGKLIERGPFYEWFEYELIDQE